MLTLLDQGALNINDKSIVHIILEQPLHGCVNIVNVDALNLAGDVVLGAKVEHVLSLLNASNRAPANPEAPCEVHAACRQ